MKFTLIKELTKALFQETGSLFWTLFFFVIFTGTLVLYFYLKHFKE